MLNKSSGSRRRIIVILGVWIVDFYGVGVVVMFVDDARLRTAAVVVVALFDVYCKSDIDRWQ